MSLRITCLYPEYQRISIANNESLSNEKVSSQSARNPAKILPFTRTAMDMDLYADVMQMRQNCAEYAAAVNNLNDKADDTQKYKPIFGVLTNKEGKSDYLRTGVYALSFLPPCRRMQSSFDAADDENYFRVAGMAGAALANLPSDITEMGLALNELKNVKSIKDFKGLQSQRAVSFVKDTPLEFLGIKSKRIGKFIEKFDKTLDDTWLGKKLMKYLKIDITKSEPMPRVSGGLVDKMQKAFLNPEQMAELSKKEIYNYTVQGGTIKQILGRSLLRVNVIGLAVSTALELPAIINAAKKGKTFGEKAKSVIKQTVKSAANVTLITGGIAAGAVVAGKTAGFAASLGGMAIGSTAGVIAANKFGKLVDKVWA